MNFVKNSLLLLLPLVLLSSCQSQQKESKARDFLFTNHKHYTYWDNYWRLCDTYTTLPGQPLLFRNVPESGLYLINGVDFDNTWQRIFTLNGNEQRWY